MWTLLTDTFYTRNLCEDAKTMDSEPRGTSTHVTRPKKNTQSGSWLSTQEVISKLYWNVALNIQAFTRRWYHRGNVSRWSDVFWRDEKGRRWRVKTRDMVPLRGQARTRQRKSPLVMSLERFLCCLMMSRDRFLHFDAAAKSVLGWDTRWFLSVYDIIRRSLNDVPINTVLVSWLCCVGMMCQQFPVSINLLERRIHHASV